MPKYKVVTKCYHDGRLFNVGEAVELPPDAPKHFKRLDEDAPEPGRQAAPAVETAGEPGTSGGPAALTQEKREKLESRARELGLRGNIAKMHDDTLAKKVAELDNASDKA